jgi:hypothetical protein
MLNWRAILFFAAMLLVFDESYSLLSTCQPINISTANYGSDENHCTAFGGIILGSGLTYVVHFLHNYEQELIAGFTIVLAVSTIGLWLSTKHLWETTRSAVELANREFASTHRPRMRLKHAWFTDQTAWRLNGPLEINLDFVNIGNTNARITWINYQSLIIPAGQRLPQRPPYDEFIHEATRITRFRSDADLPSGVTLARPVCDGILDPQEVHDILWGARRLFLIGTIEYWDSAGLRQTAFCRRFTYQTYPPAVDDMGRFEVETDPDYEYED